VEEREMKKKFTVVLFFAIAIIGLPILAKAEKLTVMTRNLYLGAEIQSLSKVETVGEFYAGVQAALAQAAANNFPERAVTLATEIAEKKPHLVGLQEVFNYTVNGFNAQPPFRDYLDDLLQALDDQGTPYYVAAVVKNFDITLPINGMEFGVLDRDVILAREDVDTEIVNLGSFCIRPSLDGCNYQIVAQFPSPVGPIAFERGFIAVDTIYGRLFSTHLEVRDPDPDNPLSAYIQSVQAAELLAMINAANVIYPPIGPVIVVGDINSSPEHQPAGGIIPTPYTQFINAGFDDAWTLSPGKPKGFTCCYAENLSELADLYERVDMIFTDTLPLNVKANVVGNDESGQTPSGLWPSDHAGVVATMEF
jgi:hypothetical protein